MDRRRAEINLTNRDPHISRGTPHWSLTCQKARSTLLSEKLDPGKGREFQSHLMSLMYWVVGQKLQSSRMQSMQSMQSIQESLLLKYPIEAKDTKYYLRIIRLWLCVYRSTLLDHAQQSRFPIVLQRHCYCTVSNNRHVATALRQPSCTAAVFVARDACLLPLALFLHI